MISLNQLKTKKLKNKKITWMTCYDHWSAQLIKKSSIDALLVGDSVSMVVHGFDSTIHATLEMMATHTQAVQRAKSEKLIISDLPFLAHRKGTHHLMDSAQTLMKAGAHAVKIETGPGQEDVVKYLTDSGVPTVGHLGLTPQYVHQLGGYKVQGKTEEASDMIFNQAQALEASGAQAIVLECVPSSLASRITKSISIPTIGIGAGIDVDGQVLVMHGLLGFNNELNPRFVRQFAKGEEWMLEAIEKYTHSVENKKFPSLNESFL